MLQFHIYIYYITLPRRYPLYQKVQYMYIQYIYIVGPFLPLKGTIFHRIEWKPISRFYMLKVEEWPSIHHWVFLYFNTVLPNNRGHYVYSTEVSELHCIWYMCWVKGKERNSYIFITLYVAQRWESYTVYDICVGWKVRKGTVIYL